MQSIRPAIVCEGGRNVWIPWIDDECIGYVLAIFVVVFFFFWNDINNKKNGANIALLFFASKCVCVYVFVSSSVYPETWTQSTLFLNVDYSPLSSFHVSIGTMVVHFDMYHSFNLWIHKLICPSCHVLNRFPFPVDLKLFIPSKSEWVVV